MTGTPSNPPTGAGPDRKGDDQGPSAGEFAGLGLQFVIALLGGLYGGQWLDRRVGTAPWLSIIGMFLGAGLAFYSMYQKLMAAQAREDAARKAKRDAQG
jgi:F0F1-type ATP synthase assembly protein I